MGIPKLCKTARKRARGQGTLCLKNFLELLPVAVSDGVVQVHCRLQEYDENEPALKVLRQHSVLQHKVLQERISQ